MTRVGSQRHKKMLLHSGYRHVSATLVAIFRAVRTRLHVQLECVQITPLNDF